jgi:hypothetical protein
VEAGRSPDRQASVAQKLLEFSQAARMPHPRWNRPAATRRNPMPQFRYKEATGSSDEITVIEDKSMFVKDTKGNWSPGFEFIDSRTVKAHPFIIDALLEDAERLWTIDEVLQQLED